MHYAFIHFLDEVTEIERKLKEANVPLSVLLGAAGIDRSTWTRWRAKTTIPRLDRWEGTKAAAARIFLTHESSIPAESECRE